MYASPEMLSPATAKRARLAFEFGIEPVTTDTAVSSSFVPLPKALSFCLTWTSCPADRLGALSQSLFPAVPTTRFPSLPSNFEEPTRAFAPATTKMANAVTASAISTRLIPPSPFRVDCRADPSARPNPLQARFLPVCDKSGLVLVHPLQHRHEDVVAQQARTLWVEAHEDGEILHVHVQHVAPSLGVVRDKNVPRLRRALRQPILCLLLVAPSSPPTGRTKTFFTPHSADFWLGVYESLVTQRPAILEVPVQVKLPPLEQPESVVPSHFPPMSSWTASDPGVMLHADAD